MIENPNSQANYMNSGRNAATTPLPLAGIKIVEIGQNIAVPYASEILASLGADVLKVERPEGGDDARGSHTAAAYYFPCLRIVWSAQQLTNSLSGSDCNLISAATTLRPSMLVGIGKVTGGRASSVLPARRRLTYVNPAIVE